ncbi:MAG: hypothetical protein A3A51_04005 [Candidatus Levybacteria bacterium RIFCSPLOWO2_01_FULL_39_10]|nr:MAG: hypothetical protein A3A51_04005 [Candidatus Levybacteria bacterium RIFCSPLOWO2_01_FULL_39_10]
MKRVYITLIILAVVIAITTAWWINGTSPADKNNTTPKIFIVEQGQGVRAIAKNLKDTGLIRDQVAFFLLTKKLGLDSKIQAGSFRLNPSMTAEEIANELTLGTLDIWITIPEGMRSAEIADILSKTMPNYDEGWDETLDENEGYLFPDTYLFPKDSDVETIVSIMRNNFDNKFASLDKSNTDLTDSEIVILASLIEREARREQDRPIVSSVINNRLGIGMKLDIDATLQYVLGYQDNQKRWWKEGLTNQDKLLNSPYNTYRVAGLPPGPISNPGLASLQAAVNPATTDYLYYITDRSGTNRYAETLAEHEENIATYGL